ACACQAQGRRFETDHPLQSNPQKVQRIRRAGANREPELEGEGLTVHPRCAARRALRDKGRSVWPSRERERAMRCRQREMPLRLTEELQARGFEVRVACLQ